MGSWLYNSVTVSIPKNIAQFLMGTVLFFVAFGSLDMTVTAVALCGFLLSYSSIYLFNDVMDVKSDRKDAEKRKWKLVASGDLSPEGAVSISFIMLITGLSLSFLVNAWFGLLIVTMLVLNVLHSASFVRLKRNFPATAANMTAIEFLKYSGGWFALTSNLSMFPLWLVLSFAISYTFIYLAYKVHFKRDVLLQKKAVLAPLGLAGIATYAGSIVLYSFPLALLLMLFFASLIAMTRKVSGMKLHMMKNSLLIEYVMIPLALLSFLMLMNPMVSAVNEQVCDGINNYTEDVSSALPEGIVGPIEQLNHGLEGYRSLEDLGLLDMIRQPE